MTLQNIFLTAFVTFCTWILAKFIADPLLQFFRLRREIHEEMIYCGDIFAQRGDVIKAQARDRLRRLASQLQALYVCEFETTHAYKLNILKWGASLRGYDLKAASEGLFYFSNKMEDSEKALARAKVEKALKLPRTLSDNELEKVERRVMLLNSSLQEPQNPDSKEGTAPSLQSHLTIDT